MKRLFTLVALMAMVLGASAKWSDQPIYKIDYSKYTEFPFYVMGYAPSFDGTAMVDAPTTKKLWRGNENDYPGDEAMSGEVTVNGTAFKVQELGENQWRQYFAADGITTAIDGKYKVIAKVKATGAVTVNVNMRWSWSADPKNAQVAIPESSDFQEVEWEYEGIGGTSCSLIAQPGAIEQTIEWQSIEVYAWEKDGQRPKEWLQDIENGDAEKSWAEMGLADVKFNDTENNFKVCAWGKEREVNMNDDGGWDPFPATIEEENGNHYFVVHGKPATTDGDAAAWDNQFWIQSKHAWKSGTSIHLKFDYKASKAVTVPTQTHKQNPSDYLIWHCAGDISFTEEWQSYDKTFAFEDDMAGGWSVAFQLNQNDKDAIDFYFDNLSWEYLKLDEGYFLSGVHVDVNPSYDDLDNAIQFEDGVDVIGNPCLVATFGTKGDANTYVDQVMVSTTRGDDSAFKGATLKPEYSPKKSDPEEWITYAASANARIDLPGLGVWKVYLDTEYESMAFEMLEGTPYEQPDPVAVVTNETEVVVKGLERDDLKDEWNNNTQEVNVREEADNNPDDEHGLGGAGHEGQTWDNQFFIKANRALKKGEVTKLVFKYKSTVAEAKTTTQCHGETPGSYMHWAAINDVVFTDEWQDFEKDFTVPNEADGMWCIAFNMAEIKGACDYSIKDVQWYLFDSSLDAGLTYENLIESTGSTVNFFVKEGAGTTPYQFGTDPSGITNVTAKKNSSSAIYNIAGQKVDKNFKGIVVKDGKKFVNK